MAVPFRTNFSDSPYFLVIKNLLGIARQSNLICNFQFFESLWNQFSAKHNPMKSSGFLKNFPKHKTVQEGTQINIQLKKRNCLKCTGVSSGPQWRFQSWGEGRVEHLTRQERFMHTQGFPPPLLSLATSLLLGGEGDSKVSTVIHRTKRYTLLWGNFLTCLFFWFFDSWALFFGWFWWNNCFLDYHFCGSLYLISRQLW